jgi:protein phosphatase
VTGFDTIEYASLSDVGVRRSHNQDNHAVLLASDPAKWQQDGHLFLVADGMGAHAVGEKASELAASIIPLTYHKHSHQGPIPALRKAFIEANASIHARGQQNREFEGMGTTGTALLLRPEGAWVAHVGDSRAYRIRDGVIEQLSFDHSLLWEYARRQHMDPATVQNIPSNVIVRSLGPEPLVQVDIEGPHPLREGDVFVLCSDGLSGQVTDLEIGAVVSTLPPAEACKCLVDFANLRGGPDNTTVVIVRVSAAIATPESSSAGNRGKALLRVVPWPLLALFLGILLAAGATGLAFAQLTALAAALFVVAALVIVGGMIGLVLNYQREKEQPADETAERPPAKVYRQGPCHIEAPLLTRLASAAQSLKQVATEKQWECDWPEYQFHFEQAAEFQRHDRFVEGFREYCRAMRPLITTLQRHRSKDDGFQSGWERTEG